MIIKTLVYPQARKPRVEAGSNGDLRIYVSQPAQDGRANEAVRTALAEFFKVKKHHVRLLRGTRSKQKFFEIGA